MTKEDFYIKMGEKLGKIDTIAASVLRIEKYILGNIKKVEGIATQVKVQWFLFSVLIFALVGWAVKGQFLTLSKKGDTEYGNDLRLVFGSFSFRVCAFARSDWNSGYSRNVDL